jgi:hypothetical protein
MMFTVHAIERFIERHAPELTYDEARKYLEENAEQASRLRQRTVLGQEQWQIAEPPCVLVVKTTHTGRVCVTVLPAPEHFGGITEDEMEIIREASARLPPIEVPPPSPPKPKGPPPKVEKPPSRKDVSKSLPQEPVRAAHVAQLHQKIVELAIVREKERTLRHESRNEATIDRQKICLRAAVRYLLNKADTDPLAKQICEEIQAQDPYLLTETFLKDKVRNDVNTG